MLSGGSGSGEFDLSKFRICEPSKNETVEDDLASPPAFQRGEADSFLRRFMQPSNPGSRATTQPSTPNLEVKTPQTPDLKPRTLLAPPRTPPTPATLGSNAPTVPSSPNPMDPPTPETVIDYDDCFRGIHPHRNPPYHSSHSFHACGQTPMNSTANSMHTTPSTSKRTTGIGPLTLPTQPEHIPNSSMIVPVMIPDRTGNLMNTERDDMKIKMAMRFGILVSDYKKVFPVPDPSIVTINKDQSTIQQRRRSVTFMNLNPRDETKPKYLLVDQRGDDHLRTRSTDAKVNVRLLLSVSDLCQFQSVHINGQAFRAVLNDTRDRMSRRPRRFTSDTVDLFFENTFIACQNLTVLSSQCVMPPLRDKDGTIITVNGASNILGQMYVKGWPGSNEPIIGWYSDDRASSEV